MPGAAGDDQGKTTGPGQSDRFRTGHRQIQDHDQAGVAPLCGRHQPKTRGAGELAQLAEDE